MCYFYELDEEQIFLVKEIMDLERKLDKYNIYPLSVQDDMGIKYTSEYLYFFLRERFYSLTNNFIEEDIENIAEDFLEEINRENDAELKENIIEALKEIKGW